MERSDEFNALNAKVRSDSATPEERARWQELKQAILAERKPDDKRRFPRAVLPLNVAFASDEELTRAVARDLGAGGISIALSGDFEIDSQYQLQINLPNDESVSVDARVAWIGGGHVGFEFLGLPDALRDRLDALVWEEIDVADF